MPYVFLFECKVRPYTSYYVVADSMDELMQNCATLKFLNYRRRIPLIDVVTTIESIPDGKGGYYESLKDANLDLHVDPCSLCRLAVCGKSLAPSPLKARWGGRKLNRYPGRAGEEDE